MFFFIETLPQSTAEASKNFINISLTISQRQQSRQASTYYNGMYCVDNFILPTKVKTKYDLSDTESYIKEIMTDKDLVSSEMEFKCRKYKTNDLVVLKKSDKWCMEVGIVKGFLIRKKKVFVILRRCIMRVNNLRFFESNSIRSELEFVDIEFLQDSYPLLMRGTEQKFITVPHHHISFCYD